MEPYPDEIPDFSPFIKMRRIQLDPESVVGKELLDRFAEFDHSFAGHSRIWAVVVKLIGLTAMCSKAVIDLEKEVIDLRRELDPAIGRNRLPSVPELSSRHRSGTGPSEQAESGRSYHCLGFCNYCFSAAALDSVSASAASPRRAASPRASARA